MDALKTQNSTRQFYLDWLRILLILTVFLFHIGMIFNSFGWHIKNDQLYSGLDAIMSFLHLWRMPLLFLISGAGTYYALEKRSKGQYLTERTKRLLVPLISGIFILVPVQVYFERIQSYDSLLEFYPHMFEGVYPAGNFSWHHLWFIAYLFLISLLIFPLFSQINKPAYLRSQKQIIWIISKKGGINIIIIPLFLSQLLLKPYFPVETHDVVNDWAFISYNLIFFLSGFILFVNQDIIHQLKKQRHLLLWQALILTLLWFLNRFYFDAAWQIEELVRVSAAWSCSVAVLCWSAVAINKDGSLRKPANQAIYPFYLVHQPIIIISGYFIIQWPLADGIKAMLILLLSFALSVAVYWLLIRPFNLMRVLFGMRKTSGKILKHNAFPFRHIIKLAYGVSDKGNHTYSSKP